MKILYTSFEKELVGIYETKYRNLKRLTTVEKIEFKTKLENLYLQYSETIQRSCRHQPCNINYFLYIIENMHYLISLSEGYPKVFAWPSLDMLDVYEEIPEKDITNGRLEEIHKIVWYDRYH